MLVIVKAGVRDVAIIVQFNEIEIKKYIKNNFIIPTKKLCFIDFTPQDSEMNLNPFLTARISTYQKRIIIKFDMILDHEF